MVTVGMNYSVLPGKEGVFEKAFQHVLEVMKGSAGHADSHLYKDVSKPNSYLIISEWNDPSEFQAFVKSEAFAKVTNWGKEQILSDRPRHRILVPQTN